MAPSLEEIQDGLLDDVHAGRGIDRDAVLAAHPEHREDLAAFLDLLDVVEGGEDYALPPSRLGEYRILREIGRGGMGIVYEAEQTTLRRRVALKVLPATLRMDVRLVSRFRKEAEAAGRLSHPGIVPVFGVGEASGAPFFAMEFVPGRTLREIIKLRKAGEAADLPQEEDAWRRWAVETCARVADALAYAHGEGILHRDVKPGNILINSDGAPRLTDFGLARDLRSPGLSLTGEVIGSPQYMSPEQAVRHDRPVDERTDIYSLAVTLYQLISLELPYPAATHTELLTALAAGRVIAPRRVDAGMSRSLEQVLLRALRKEPRERYADAASFAADLRAAIDGRRPAFPGTTPARTALPYVLAFVAATAGAIFVFGSDGNPAGEDPAEKPGPAEVEAPVKRTVERLLARYAKARPTDSTGFLTYLRPLRGMALAQGASEGERALVLAARLRIATDYVAGPGGDDGVARRFVGHRAFEHAIPEALTHRGYDFLRAVAWAAQKRWFRPEEFEQLALAEEAWEDTERHVERLLHDAEFNRGDKAAAELGLDRHLAGYYLTTLFRSPYLICHASAAPHSPYDKLALDPAEGRAAGEEPAIVEARLREQASLLTQLHAEYLRRSREALSLKPLMTPWGGRPDYPGGVRSFRDGVPLVVIYFADQATFREHVRKTRRYPDPLAVTGYFCPRTSFVYLHAPTAQPAAIEFARRRTVHEGTRQLEFWYYRQRNRWQKPRPSRGFFAEGFAEILAGFDRAQDGTLRFHGVSESRLQAMQSLAKTLRARDVSYHVFPLQKLVTFSSYAEFMEWGSVEWQLSRQLVVRMYLAQSWALVYFLDQGAGGRYRKGLARYHELLMKGGSGGADLNRLRFKTAFALEADDWVRMDKAFRNFVTNDLLKRKIK